ncbi:hypothetical protein OHA25_60095 (plasmid) [Nonomuraea sp. NBC_00507]|uniref:hypothetical protein n=1 Tax=Nonomuraea sp. NBC_00507 TaxID=2976002 RepID=UPI002E17764F
MTVGCDVPDDVIKALREWYAAQATVWQIVNTMPSALDEDKAELREGQRRVLAAALADRDEAETALWAWWTQAESPIAAWRALRRAAMAGGGDPTGEPAG